MKLFIFLVLSSVVLLAEETPEYLRDGRIVVTLKSGKQNEYSTNEWMVVRRGAKKAAPEVASKTPEERHFEEPLHHRNRVRLLGGAGPVGLQSEQQGQVLHVESRYGLVAGIGYDRSLSNRFSLSGAIYTNGTFSLGVGMDF